MFFSVKTLLECRRIPPSKQIQLIIKFCLSQPTALMTQLALWAHAVITISRDLALVVGFERTVKDPRWKQQVFFHYSTEMDKVKFKVWLNDSSDKNLFRKLKNCTSLMTQRALWVHTVITLSRDPAVVVGFERTVKDPRMKQQVFFYYSTEVDKVKLKVWLNNSSDKILLRKLKKCTN